MYAESADRWEGNALSAGRRTLRSSSSLGSAKSRELAGTRTRDLRRDSRLAWSRVL